MHGTDKIGWVRRYNRALSALAEKDKVVFLDVTDDFLQKDGTLDGKLFRDGLHPNPAGYEVLAEKMEKVLKENAK